MTNEEKLTKCIELLLEVTSETLDSTDPLKGVHFNLVESMQNITSALFIMELLNQQKENQ